MVMAMREGLLPKSLHIDEPSTKVDWSQGKVELLTEAEPWQPNGQAKTSWRLLLWHQRHQRPRDLGGSAKGDFLRGDRRGAKAPQRPGPPAALGKDRAGAERGSSRLATHLEDNPELELTDIAYSLATTRAAFSERAVVVGSERRELIALTEGSGQGEPSPNTAKAKATQGKLAYLLSGQGSQRPGMGKELYAKDDVFKEAFDQACEEIDPHIDGSLKEIVFAEGDEAKERLSHTTYAQPALFALHLALHKTLEAKGLEPDCSPATRSERSPPPTSQACSLSQTRQSSSAPGAD